VKQAQLHRFQSDPHPCHAAHRAVLKQCSTSCGACKAEDAGCSAPARAALLVDGDELEADGVATPARVSADAAAVACDSPCVFQGVNQTCSEHIIREASSRFQDKGAESCALAVTTVTIGCRVCGGCPLGVSGCKEHVSVLTTTTSAQSTETSTSRLSKTAGEQRPADTFDCSKAREDAARWSKDQRQWCCQNYGEGCRGLLVKALP
jgi:hypothetical protein